MLKNKYVLICWLVVFFAGFSFAASEGDLNKPDTVKVESIPEVGSNQSFVVSVTAFTDRALRAFLIPLTFHSKDNPDIACDSIKWSKWVLEANPTIEGTSIDTVNSKLKMGAFWLDKGLPQGDETLARIYFHTGPKWKKGKGLVIDTTVYYPPSIGVSLEFVEEKEAEKEAQSFKPVFVKGYIGPVSK